jgi:hypothetical protein
MENFKIILQNINGWKIWKLDKIGKYFYKLMIKSLENLNYILYIFQKFCEM